MRRETDSFLAMLRQHRKKVMVAMTAVASGILFAALFDLIFAPTPESQVVLAYGDFTQRVAAGQVTDIWTDGVTIQGRLNVVAHQKDSSRASKQFITRMPGSGDPLLVDELGQSKVRVNPPQVTFVWDFISSAPSFSTLSAVLAGFVIVAIVAILTFDPKPVAVEKHVPIPALLTAFLSLVVAAFLYSVVAGNKLAAGIDLAAHAEGFCVSWILAVGVVQTCVGVTWMLRVYGMPDNVVQTSVGICHCAVVIAAVSTSGLLVLPLYELYGNELIRNTIAWIFTLTTLVVSIPIGRLLARGLNTSEQRVLMDRLSIPALASVLFATALFSALTGIGNGLVRDVYGPIFAILVFLQLGLGFEFALYEASLPTTGHGTVLGRWVERWVEGRSSQQMSLQLN